MNIAVCVLCAALMALGAAELVRLAAFRWMAPLTGKKFALLIRPDSAEECECVVRAAAERIRWLELKGPCELLCLNPTGDEEIERICRFLRLRYPFLRVCKTCDLVYNLEEK